jgi:membrane protease YdiL (CAAX protease family)
MMTGGSTKINRIYEALLCTFGLGVFSFFIHFSFPYRLLSFAGLILTAFFMSRQWSAVKMPLFVKKFTFRNAFAILMAIILGFSIAFLYRNSLRIPLLLNSIQIFAVIAALIGIFEEIVFRGFIQGRLKEVNVLFSIFFGSFSHTIYKCCLFLSPVMLGKIDISFLAFWTFCCGLLFGILKQYSRSTIPPAIAHALFDVLVYGQCLSAPCWVW